MRTITKVATAAVGMLAVGVLVAGPALAAGPGDGYGPGYGSVRLREHEPERRVRPGRRPRSLRRDPAAP